MGHLVWLSLVVLAFAIGWAVGKARKNGALSRGDTPPPKGYNPPPVERVEKPRPTPAAPVVNKGGVNPYPPKTPRPEGPPPPLLGDLLVDLLVEKSQHASPPPLPPPPPPLRKIREGVRCD